MKLVQWRRPGAVLGAVLVFGGCVDVVGPGWGRTDVAVRTMQGVVYAEASGVTDFRVSLELTNLGPNWVSYDRWCGWRVDQLVNGTWTVAYTPYCSVYNSEYEWIPPGATYYETIQAHASWRRNIGAPVVGTYRVVYDMVEDIDGRRYETLRQDRTTSNSFLVR